LLVAIASLLFSRSAAESNFLRQLERVIGSSGAHTLRTVIDASHHAGSGAIAGIAAAGALFFGASGVFVELRNSLNLIWGVPEVPWSWRGLITQRLVSFLTILILGGLLLISLLLTAVLGVIGRFLGDLIPAGTIAGGEILNLLVSPLIIAALFALIFKFVPDVPVAWRDVLGGAVVTSILFSLGRTGLSFYLRTAGVGSVYGVAGSVVALVVWVYYSAQIFFFGAILTRIYAERHGSRALH
jgi:membrane protein